MGCGSSARRADSNSQPGKVSNPTPPDGASGVSPDIKLTWMGTPGVWYNVYFGAEPPPPFAGKHDTATFDPGPLEWDTTYYWSVDIAGGAAGNIWKFTTFWYGDPNAEEMDI